jgi:hypothetical protein
MEASVKAKIGEEYSDCLCGKCLKEIAEKFSDFDFDKTK